MLPWWIKLLSPPPAWMETSYGACSSHPFINGPDSVGGLWQSLVQPQSLRGLMFYTSLHPLLQKVSTQGLVFKK